MLQFCTFYIVFSLHKPVSAANPNSHYPSSCNADVSSMNASCHSVSCQDHKFAAATSKRRGNWTWCNMPQHSLQQQNRPSNNIYYELYEYSRVHYHALTGCRSSFSSCFCMLLYSGVLAKLGLFTDALANASAAAWYCFKAAYAST